MSTDNVITDEEKLAVLKNNAMSSQYSVVVGNFVLYDEELQESITEPDENILQNNIKYVTQKIEETALQAVKESHNTLPYELSEKIAFAYIKTRSEANLENWKNLHQTVLQQKNEATHEILAGWESDIYRMPVKNEVETRQKLLEKAADNKLYKEQIKFVIQAIETLDM